MADDSKQVTNVKPESSKSGNYDPSLDFFSEHFDPLKALCAANIKVPVPKAKIYDNLSKYDSEKRGLTTERKSKIETEAPSLKFERRFLPHQLPIKTERKTKKSVLTRMGTFTGPLQTLKRCVDEHIRVKIWTRHSHGIRGYCLGFCVAFDKHWNLALEDVTEVWTRSRKRKVPALGDMNIQQISKKRIVPPKIVIKKVTKKLEYCERHVPQLLMRGEQVAFINIEKL